MKNVSFMPVSYVRNYQSENCQNRKFITNYNDSVSFKGGQAKTKKAVKDVFGEILKNGSPDLGKQIDQIMSDTKSRNIFMTTLVSLAVAVTNFWSNKDKPEILTDIIEVIQKKDNDNTQKSDDEAKKLKEKVKEKENKTSKKPTKAKTTSSKTKLTKEKEALKAKLQELSDQGLTLKEIGQRIGKSEATAWLYIKQLNVTRTNCPTTKKRQTNQVQKEETKKDNNKRAEFLEQVKSYPNIAKKYEQLIDVTSKEPKNEINNQAINGLEMIFEHLNTLPSKFRKKTFEMLNEKYAGSIDKIGIIVANIQAGKTIQEYINDLDTKNYSADDIEKWAEYPAFTQEEYRFVSMLPQNKIAEIHNLKKEGTFKFRIYRDGERHNYKFVLDFADGVSLRNKLKTTSDFYEALYEKIYLHKDTGNKVQRRVDIKNELLTLLNKDLVLDSVYNLVKYLEPEKFTGDNYKTGLYMPLDKQKEKNIYVKAKLEPIIKNLDVEHNIRYIELEKVLNDDNISDLISNNHAKLRFISRFVLNKNIEEGELRKKCEQALDSLKSAIENQIQSGYSVFPYTTQGSSAPCFYIIKSELGDFVRITLNNQGQIHTLFEDLRKKNR